MKKERMALKLKKLNSLIAEINDLNNEDSHPPASNKQPINAFKQESHMPFSMPDAKKTIPTKKDSREETCYCFCENLRGWIMSKDFNFVLAVHKVIFNEKQVLGIVEVEDLKLSSDNGGVWIAKKVTALPTMPEAMTEALLNINDKPLFVKIPIKRRQLTQFPKPTKHLGFWGGVMIEQVDENYFVLTSDLFESEAAYEGIFTYCTKKLEKKLPALEPITAMTFRDKILLLEISDILNYGEKESGTDESQS